jgi:hypothetical protein
LPFPSRPTTSDLPPRGSGSRPTIKTVRIVPPLATS